MLLSSVHHKAILTSLCALFISAVLVVPAHAVSSSDDLIHPLYYGAGWIAGSDHQLGDVEIYVPISSKGSWGTSQSGYLVNISNSTFSGIMVDRSGTQYTFTCSGFSFPRYRLLNSTGYYDYKDLALSVTGSNVQVAREFPQAVTAVDSYPLITIGLLGVGLLCLMRFRHS